MAKLDDDLLWGVAAIAAAIGRKQRWTALMLARGELPARKVGQGWVASRRRLLAFLKGEDA